jgi:UDP-hydrolysing UDP-N-acetyl-D-glucosamine 2-epimerase
MNQKNIFIISTNRSDYGLLQTIIKDFNKFKKYHLIVVKLVTHMADEIDQTINVNWHEELIYYSSGIDNEKLINKGILEINEGFLNLVVKFAPKILIVLGDRYELLPIVSQALVSKIPIAHLSGGEITLGAIDDKIRNMVSFASDIHLVAHEQAETRLKKLLGKNESNNIFTVGEPGLEEIKKTNFKSIMELSEIYKINLNQKFILCTLHPETNNPKFLESAKIFFKTIANFDDRYPFLISYGNHDPTEFDINELMKISLSKRKNTFICRSFGQINYWSLLNYAHIVIGNSSSGLVEAPFLGCWTVDVGDRQKGRIYGTTVKRIEINKKAIDNALLYFLGQKRSMKRKSPYGEGDTSEKVLRIVDNFLKKNN